MVERHKDNLMVPVQEGYEISKFNAVRHGVLSRHTVLPWETRDEYEALLNALVEEYDPAGPTEAHLVEELAGIVWRKRRLKLAEAADLHGELRRVITNSSSWTIKSALVLQPEQNGDFDWMSDIFTMDSAKLSEELNDANNSLQKAKHAYDKLEKNQPEVYEKALKILLPGTEEWWLETLEEDSDYKANAESLLKFLDEEVIPYFSQRLAVLQHHDAIMNLAYGKAIDVEKMNNLSRYEVFLDRKLERTLSMLLKLKDLRQEPTSDAE